MDFKKLAAPSLKELFVTELENMILSGKLEIGAKLPPERELAESMGVSRAVVNAGIVEVANKGFLSVKPRVGTFVEDYRRKGTLDTLISIMNYNGGTLRRPEIKSILEVRTALDTLGLLLFKKGNLNGDIKVLEKCLKVLKEAKTDKDAAIAAFEFIHEFYILTGNTLLPLICYSFKAPVLNLWERFCRKNGKEVLFAELNDFYTLLSNNEWEKALEHVNNMLSETVEGKYQIYSD